MRSIRLRFEALFCVAGLLFAGAVCRASSGEIDALTDPIAHNCTGCSEAQIVDKARSFGRGSHYVYDLIGNGIHLISVECEPAPGGVSVCSGEEVAVPADVSEVFHALKTAYDANGHSLTFGPGVDVIIASPNSLNSDGTRHDDGYINTYDILTISAADFLVMKCLSDFTCTYSFVSGSPALQAALIQLIQVFKNSFINFADVVISFTVTFHDGSQAVYKYDTAAKSWTMIPGTARDSDHNLIDPLPHPPHQFIVHDGGYNGGNIAHLVNTQITGGPHCVAIEWDGEHLTCILAP